MSILFVALIVGCGCRRNTPPTAPALDDAGRVRFVEVMNLGKGFYEQHEWDKAVESFDEAVRLDGSSDAARLNLALALHGAMKYGRVLKLLGERAVSDRLAVRAGYLRGLALLHEGDAAGAVAALSQVQKQEPDIAAVQFQFGKALFGIQDYEAAEVHLRKALKLDQFHPSATHLLGQIAFRTDREAEGQRLEVQRKRLFELLQLKDVGQEVIEAFLERCALTRLVDIPSPVQPDEVMQAVKFLSKPPMGLGTSIAVLPSGEGVDDVLSWNHGLTVNSLVNALPGPRLTRVDADVAIRKLIVAEVNGDSLLDVAALGQQSFLFIGRADGVLEDATEMSNLGFAEFRDGIWVDLDHDGDVDLVGIDRDGLPIIYQNDGLGVFQEATTLASLPAELRDLSAVGAVDWNQDDAIDLLFASPAGSWIVFNGGLGLYSAEHLKPRRGPAATSLAVNDLNNDGQADVVWVTDGELVIDYGDDVVGLPQKIDGVEMALLIDVDNDGWLDVLSADAKLVDGQRSLRLWRNAGARGWEDVTGEVGLATFLISENETLMAGDVDGDGDSDLLIGHERSVHCVVNDGGTARRSVKVELQGSRSNYASVGSVVELRAGGFRVNRFVDGGPMTLGVGDRKTFDTLSAVWPTGISDSRIGGDVTREMVTMVEPTVAAGSCPYLYAWDGEGFRFVTDILGASPLGLSVSRDRVVPADTDEFVWIGDSSMFVPRDGTYVVKITDELREVLYLDEVKLAVVDHPVGTEVHGTDRLPSGPAEASRLLTVDDIVLPIRVTDDAGRDWTAAVLEIDGVFAVPAKPLGGRLRGLAEKHSWVIDFGDIEAGGSNVLVLTGWLQYGDASVNVGWSQRADAFDPFPKLFAEVGDEWAVVDVAMGAPAGKTKTIVCDLTGKLPAGARRLRMDCGFELYWDRLVLARSVTEAEVTMLSPMSAALSWHGYGQMARASEHGPMVPSFNERSDTPPWRRAPEGWCTVYGDVLPLIAERDDDYVIFNGGDGCEIAFDAGGLGPVPDGYVRNFFLYSDGWDKDGDHHVVTGGRVGPLPYHGQDDQAYGREGFEGRDSAVMGAYNRRWVEGDVKRGNRQ